MDAELNCVERDFVEFMSQKTGKPIAAVERLFCQTRRRFRFADTRYSRLTGDLAHLYRLLYDTDTEEGMIECYQVHALPNLLKYISYTYPKPKTRYFRDLVRDVRKLEWRNAWNLLRRKLVRKAKTSGVHLGPRGIAEVLTSLVDGPPVVVDYGSGLAYISYEIAGLRSDSAIFLLDVESLVLEFALFRLKKTGATVHAIPVTKENIYPELPDHNICIASEVMEHLAQPLKAYDNIFRSLRPGGLLYGRFDDHQPNMYHVSPNLCALRRRLAEDFEQVDQWCYRKKG
ncbi:MAG TPA: methyltransferase domain-containing protein [Anaerohalosphaeraceae bacterium]|jgi:SAM-dependent methyltransferase|nr:methyltransferase domain-containing protein [Anaerohalosphaeraceae bacterium]HRT49986.1 methyltransferase domain-containing protein [Anaerohalosphaeraceae bacterium]HRT85716.1 methyltransferase domain-containing protein [Anaerohalosphaeraceae bacterium]